MTPAPAAPTSASSSALPAVADASAPLVSERLAFRGDLLDFVATPAWGDVAPAAARFRANHWLLVEDGRIAGVQAHDPGDSWQRHDHAGRLILPGFIDTHVHCPQLDVIASYGTELLGWLERYTFPAEQRWADRAHAEAGAARFLDALLAHGTTSAMVFATVHETSVEALFQAAVARGMRVISGKVLMDRHAPDGLRDDALQTGHDCTRLIERWHGRDRLAWAVTVRFAPTSSPAQLAMAGRLCAAHPGVYLQTHLAETRDEVRWVAELFPQARSYLDVYEQAGLVGARSVFAHGIWLDDTDLASLHRAGAQIAHCPTSNLFLGSGLFDWPRCQHAGVAVSLGSDVGGGTSLCQLCTMAESYKVQALAGHRLTAWKALHAATLGAAQSLGLSHEIGSLEPGLLADVCIWDWAVGSVATHRQSMAQDLHERVFAWMTLADERNLVAAHVAGVSRYRRSAG